MLSTPTGTSRPEARPLTHRDCLTAGRNAPSGGTGTGRPWVQVRRHHPGGAYVLCGQVTALRDDGAELFKVDTSTGPVWAQGRSLRMCSGDGRCTCEANPAGATGAAGKP